MDAQAGKEGSFLSLLSHQRNLCIPQVQNQIVKNEKSKKGFEL